MIPKILHRIWFGGPMPPQFVEFGESWRKHNPDWKMIEWGPDDFGWLENQDLFDRARELAKPRLVYRFQSDLARYEILYRMGGVYIDCDFEALKPLGTVFDSVDCFAVKENAHLLANGMMGSTLHHPFIGALVKGARKSIQDRPGQDPWRICGTEYLTRMARLVPGLHVFPSRPFIPYHHSDLGKQIDLRGCISHHVWASGRGQVSVIIPYRYHSRERQRNLEWVLKQYNERYPEWQVIVTGENQGAAKFNKARALLEGVEQSFGDILVVADADCWANGLHRAVKATERFPWIIPYGQLRRLSPTATRRVLRGESLHPALPVEVVSPGVEGGGIIVCRRSVFEQVPPDPRFAGWGGEDVAWGVALGTLVSPPKRGLETLWHLWHPPSEKHHTNYGSKENYALWKRYDRNRGRKREMLKLVKEGKKEWSSLSGRGTGGGRSSDRLINS